MTDSLAIALAEKARRAEQADAVLDALWQAHGGVGTTPPLYVSQARYAALVRDGVTPDRLRVSRWLPADLIAFYREPQE